MDASVWVNGDLMSLRHSESWRSEALSVSSVMIFLSGLSIADRLEQRSSCRTNINTILWVEHIFGLLLEADVGLASVVTKKTRSQSGKIHTNILAGGGKRGGSNVIKQNLLMDAMKL